MNKIGIICEYNPFHNGHIYHLNKIKEMFPDSMIILILNGYFTERGEISLLSKEDKIKIALNNGVSLVVELPVHYGVSSADYFSYASLYILNKLKVDYLVFGSESSDIKYLEELSNKELDINKLKITNGESYNSYLNKIISNDLIKSNDLLGSIYIKTIKKYNYNIKPICIKRTNDYKDINSNSSIVSASNIRNKINNNEDVSSYMPSESYNSLTNIDKSIYFKLLKYKILTSNNLNDYLDVEEGLDYKLKKVILTVNSYDELVNALKSKRYSYNKIRRMFIHILLGTRKNNPDIEYIHILGMNNQGRLYLNSIKKDINLKINKESPLFKEEIYSSIIYDLLTNKDTFNYEKKVSIILK